LIPTAVRLTIPPILGFALTAAAAQAAADEPAVLPDPQSAAFELGVEAYALVTFGDICSASEDLITCQNGTGAVGLGIVPRWRLLRPLSLGLLAAYGTKPGSEATVSSDGSVVQYDTRFWRLAAEGRLHPFDAQSPDIWLGVEAGVAALTDRAEGGNSGQSTFVQSKTQYAPSLGAGLGVDFYVLPRVALGLEARGMMFFFEAGDAPRSQTGVSVDKRYGTQPGLWFALTATIIPAL
jgi:hypothetical protein